MTDRKRTRPATSAGEVLTQCLVGIVFERSKVMNDRGEVIYSQGVRSLPPSITHEDIILVVQGGPVDEEMAQCLSDNFGGSKEYWLNLDKARQDYLEDQNKELEKVFKIRRISDGLYREQNGCSFGLTGRSFSSMGAVKGSVRQHTRVSEERLMRALKNDPNYSYSNPQSIAWFKKDILEARDGWEIVEVSIRQNSSEIVNSWKVSDIMEFVTWEEDESEDSSNQ